MTRPLIALLLCVALIGMAGRAVADTEVVRDARQDVTQHHYDTSDPENVELKTKLAPRNQRSDIVRVRAEHLAHRVFVRVGVREVKRGRRAHVQGAIWLRDDDRRYWIVSFTSSKRSKAWVTRVHPGKDPVDVQCEGLRYRVNRQDDAYAVSVPRECLRSPGWIRTAVQVGMTKSSDPTRTWIDYAGSGGPIQPGTAPDFGRRIRRG